ncbi:hypothetical protein PoB_003482500 [Plakobranchus ocellatus]|uniref:Uncharacterized protein n=1 Tax=Plakobranchus ocellatus TaxID=259542 RepID=A0AAV4AJH1_9GAST|nr:hypothetical protein PoB_003482500 [Plakobranchus ocellatus]
MKSGVFIKAPGKHRNGRNREQPPNRPFPVFPQENGASAGFQRKCRTFVTVKKKLSHTHQCLAVPAARVNSSVHAQVSKAGVFYVPRPHEFRNFSSRVEVT